MVDHIQLPAPEMMVDHLDGQVSTLLRENERLRTALKNARSQLATLGGTAGVHMDDEDAHETGCDMIQRAVIMNIDEALKE